MELATADAVQPREGEAAFILQLRPPATAHADALATELERFTSLYLERAAAEHVRFTPLGTLTWALCAPSESVDEVDAACDELAQSSGPAAAGARELAARLAGEAFAWPRAAALADEGSLLGRLARSLSARAPLARGEALGRRPP